jgi:hypothetical protein
MNTLQMKISRIYILFLLLFLFVPSAVSAQKKKPTKKQTVAILVSSADEAPNGTKMGSAPIVKAVLNNFDKDDLERLHRCMSENRIKKNEAKKLFVSVLLPTVNQNQQIYFVRGSLNTSCLIGAHTFDYWLVVKSKSNYNVVYSGASDAVSILRSIHKGMYDIEETFFHATNATSGISQFDGSKYVETVCKEYHRTNSGKEVVKIVPCGTFE